MILNFAAFVVSSIILWIQIRYLACSLLLHLVQTFKKYYILLRTANNIRMSQTTNTAISRSSDTVALSTSSSQYPMHHSHLFTSSSSSFFHQTTMQPTNHKNTTNNAISQTIHPHCDLLKTKSIPTRSNVKKSASCSIGTNHSNVSFFLKRECERESKWVREWEWNKWSKFSKLNHLIRTQLDGWNPLF